MKHGQIQFLLRGSRRMSERFRIDRTETIFERSRGLLGKPQLGDDQGMWIAPCNSVHTFGMRYPLDIVYLDRKHRIRKIELGLKPSRISWHLFSRSVIEFRAGAIAALDLKTGDQMQWVAHD